MSGYDGKNVSSSQDTFDYLIVGAGTAGYFNGTTAVTMWLDPVCPFSWNTARWLDEVAGNAEFEIDWQLMSLAILNEGRELPPPHGRGCANHNRSVG
jgi:hypothetical protein